MVVLDKDAIIMTFFDVLCRATKTFDKLKEICTEIII